MGCSGICTRGASLPAAPAKLDEIIPEPEGGAHNDPEAMASTLGATLERQLDELLDYDVESLIETRYRKFRGLGALAGLGE